MGNGITVFLQGTEVQVAHIAATRQITFIGNDLTIEAKEQIIRFALHHNPKFSDSQHTSVFLQVCPCDIIRGELIHAGFGKGELYSSLRDMILDGIVHSIIFSFEDFMRGTTLGPTPIKLVRRYVELLTGKKIER